jgi:hypothetical protein
VGNETNYSEVLSGTVGGDAEGLAENTSGKIGTVTASFFGERADKKSPQCPNGST